MASIRFSPIAYFFVDSKGRRFLLIVSLAAMIPLLIATGFSFTADSNSAQTGIVATFLILFTLAYSPGAGVIPFLYSSEIFPQVLRGKYSSAASPLHRCSCSLLCIEVGMAWASAVNFMGAGLLALTVPQLNQGLGQTKLLGLFA